MEGHDTRMQQTGVLRQMEGRVGSLTQLFGIPPFIIVWFPPFVIGTHVSAIVVVSFKTWGHSSFNINILPNLAPDKIFSNTVQREDLAEH